MNKSHLTAITRTKLSAPLSELWKYEEITPHLDNILDYGCGKGYDADCLSADKYDPHFFPERPRNAPYDVIYCNYVLNVIEDPKERKYVIMDVMSLLSKTGNAFFIVRDDIKEDRYTKKGTWQGVINLDNQLSLWGHKRGKYKIYWG